MNSKLKTFTGSVKYCYKAYEPGLEQESKKMIYSKL